MYNMIFFFQAEDGIRYIGVTGVQTCALPISWSIGVGAEACAPRLRYRSARQGLVPVQGRRRRPGDDRRENGRASCRERELVLMDGRSGNRKPVNVTSGKEAGKSPLVWVTGKT